MGTRERLSLINALSGRLAKGADAAHIADAVDAIWMEIDAGLFAILGQRGVAALYQRCLHATARDHPWLSVAFEGVQASMNLMLLRATLLQQTSTNAAAASRALLQKFEALLYGMVGAAMTDRLLHSVCNNFSSGKSAQGSSP